MDGDLDTAWRTGAFSDARGERLELTLAEPITTDNITLIQPTSGSRNRFITGVRLRFDGGDPVDVELGQPVPRRARASVVQFPERTFDTLSIEILADSAGVVPRYAGQTSIGFAEVAVGDDPACAATTWSACPPTCSTPPAPTTSTTPWPSAATRQRQDPSDTTRLDEERASSASCRCPSDRSFSVGGDIRLFRRFPVVRDRRGRSAARTTAR